jgi:hypothetical protein
MASAGPAQACLPRLDIGIPAAFHGWILNSLHQVLAELGAGLAVAVPSPDDFALILAT